MPADFYTKAHGKCILAGEHAVLRGNPALVFPIPSKFIELEYWATAEPLQISFNPPRAESFAPLLERLMQLLNKTPEDLRGKIVLNNSIEVGAGMGFSAALCVVLTRWCEWQGWLKPQESFEFARQLENIFHGKSSGADIAGALHENGVHYQMPGHLRSLSIHWRPQLYLSHSGKMSVTSECVSAVNQLGETNRALAIQIDADMARSVDIIEQALASDEKTGLLHLGSGLSLANSCFQRWELLSSELQLHMQSLVEAGALACKPTGAGKGGYVLSLWNKPPQVSFEMTTVFA